MKNSLFLFLFFIVANASHKSEAFSKTEKEAVEVFNSFIKCQNQKMSSGSEKIEKLSSCIQLYFNPKLSLVEKKRFAMILMQSSSIVPPFHCSNERHRVLNITEKKSNELLCTRSVDGQKRLGFISFSQLQNKFYIDNIKF